MTKATAWKVTMKQGWTERLLTVIWKRCCTWTCFSDVGTFPRDSQVYMPGSGFSTGAEWKALMAKSLIRMKWNEGS